MPRKSPESSSPPPPGPPALASSAGLKAPHSMVAAFDYNPRESSPNMDVEVSPFRAQPRRGGDRACPGLTPASWSLRRQSCPSGQGMSSLCSGPWTMTVSTM